MDMDAMEELSGSNDQTMIMKGKRTKRLRPLSPAGRATSCSSSGGGGGGGGGGESGCRDGGGDLYDPLVPSSSEISTSTEEDEDMANCLILLAQGGCNIKQEVEEIKVEKCSSRRFNEMVTTTTAKAGFYVYECKTCNRTFPSFQALGGHRASHKKPKPMVEEKKVVVATAISGEHEEEEEEEEEEDGRQLIISRPNDPPQSMELSNKASHGNNKSKIHECSICGSEFSSGQALGGHMRRHRNPTTTNTKATTDPNSPDRPRKPTNIFPLDLNLPAPEDHDHRDLKYQFAANQQHLVFSAPALVDCHY